MNPVAEELSGWNSDAAQGKPIDEVLTLILEDSGETVENPIMNALRTGKLVGLANHTVLVSKDGRRIPIDDSASPIRDSSENILGGVLVFRDISEQRNAEQLARARREQQREWARVESLRLMAGGIAHDFNNLLTGILGYAGLLSESLQGRDLSFVKEIMSAGERAAGLASQMLTYSGREWLKPVRLDLNTHISDNLTALRAALPSKAHIELELCREKYAVEADVAQIQQAITNLLANASEAMEEGSGTIAIRTVLIEHRPARFNTWMQSTVPAGMYAMIEIRDNGKGMTGETLKRIFDPFFTTKFTGRGLGLSAVLGIVKGHNGDIEVVSEPGVGSAFRIFLPATAKVVQPPARLPAPPATDADGSTILLVDDEAVVRKLGAMALRTRGFNVLLASDGSEALDVLRTEPAISAVILDLTMPVMTGEEALPLMKTMRPDLPIILSSGFSETELLRRFKALGITGVLSKPYTVASILAKVTEALSSVTGTATD